jgi:hypothetical protein
MLKAKKAKKLIKIRKRLKRIISIVIVIKIYVARNKTKCENIRKKNSRLYVSNERAKTNMQAHNAI